MKSSESTLNLHPSCQGHANTDSRKKYRWRSPSAKHLGVVLGPRVSYSSSGSRHSPSATAELTGRTAILDLYARLHDRGIVHVDVEMRHIMASQVSSLVRPRHANAAARTDGTPLINQLSARPFDLRLIDFDQSWLLPASAVADPSEIAIYTKQEKAMVARLLEVDDGVWERLEMMERWAERERGREADSKLKAGGGLAEKAPRETGDDGLSSAQ